MFKDKLNFGEINILNCKDTIPLRPNDDVGLAYERSLTIWFVESGLEKLAAGQGAMPVHGFRGIHVKKELGLNI